MFERFTEPSRRVMVLAQEEARLLGNSFIGTEHLLLGLLHQGENIGADVLSAAGVDLEGARAEIQEMVGASASAASGSMPFTPRTKKVLELSLRHALQLGHTAVGPEHLLLGLILEGQGVAVQALERMNVDPSVIRQQVIAKIAEGGGTQLQAAPIIPAAGSEEAFVHMSRAARPKLVTCSFCGRQPPASGRIVPGRPRREEGTYICEHCIKWWAAALDDEGEGEQPPAEG